MYVFDEKKNEFHFFSFPDFLVLPQVVTQDALHVLVI